MALPLFGVALLACGAARAQPAADVLLRTWVQGQEAALDAAGPVILVEDVARVIDGPRGEVEVTHRATVRYAPGERPERDVLRVTVDGRDVSPERSGAVQGRLGRAFGRAGRDVEGPPAPALVFLARGERDGPTAADVVEGQDAWRVPLRFGRRGRGAAWFSQGSAPRLLRTRFDARHRGARVTRVVDYARRAGVDLPRDVQTEATVRQRRRLREYVVTLRSAGRYAPAPPRR